MLRFSWRRASPVILIVSDNPSAPLTDSDFLSQRDVRLLLAQPDPAGLDIARCEQPSVIVDELGATPEPGLKFCEQLRRDPATRSIPLVLIAPDDLRERAGWVGADELLSAPISRRRFFRAIQRFVPLPARRRQRLTINLRFTYEAGGRTGQLFSRDLSAHGAFLKTDRMPGLGAHMDLRFRLPGTWEEIVCGAIVRSIQNGMRDGQLRGVGVEFDSMSDEDADRLEAFLQRSLGVAGHLR